MKGMRIHKKQAGGYLGALEASRPELFNTISNYRNRLSQTDQGTFDQRANIQYKASQNMPEQMRKDYYTSIDKQFAKPTDEQFAQIQKGLQSKTFVPTYRYYDLEKANQQAATPTATTPSSNAYYRDLSKEIGEAETTLSGLTLDETEQKTRKLYNYVPSAAGIGPTAPPKMVRELPKGARQTNMGYGQQVWVAPDPGNRNYMQSPQQRGYYSPAGDEKYTVTTTRAQRAGDADYDKQMGVIGRLEKRHKFRHMPQYETPNLTSTNVYQKLGMGASKGKLVKKLKQGGRASIRGTRFTGVF